MEDKFKVTNYMSPDLICLNEKQSIFDAIELFFKHDISGAPILSEDGELKGLLSEKDCLECGIDAKYNHLPDGLVGDYMSTSVKTVLEDKNIIDVAVEFVHVPYRRFPVVNREGKILGMITRRDVLRGIRDMKQSNFFRKQL